MLAEVKGTGLKYLRYGIAAVLLVLTVYVLVHNTDPGRLYAAFVQADWRLVAAGLAAGMGVSVVKAFRWKIILMPVKKVPGWEAFGILNISQLVTNVLPFRAGDIVQVMTMAVRHNISKVTVIATIAAYQFIDLVTMAAVIAALSFSAFIPPGIGRAAVFVVGMGATGVLLAMLFGGRLVEAAARSFPVLERRLRSLADGAKVFVKVKVLALTLSLTLIMWVLGVIQAWCTLAAFGIHLSFWRVMAYLVLPSLVTIIPSTPGFLGVWDAASVGILLQFGVLKEAALGVTLVTRAAGLVIISLGSLPGIAMNILPSREVRNVNSDEL